MNVLRTNRIAVLRVRSGFAPACPNDTPSGTRAHALARSSCDRCDVSRSLALQLHVELARSFVDRPTT